MTASVDITTQGVRDLLLDGEVMVPEQGSHNVIGQRVHRLAFELLMDDGDRDGRFVFGGGNFAIRLEIKRFW